jgi:hypothetical protein
MIFLHIGFPKTGTTFLQQNVFGSWPNIVYQNDLWLSYLVLQEPAKKYLVSNETLLGRPWNRDPRQPFGWLEERKLIIDGLARLFPQATILVSFRKHVGFIESLYAQYLHEGGTVTLDKFFRFDEPRGIIHPRELDFGRTIDMITARFGNRVFIFTLEQISGDLNRLLTAMGNLFGEDPPLLPSFSDLSRENKSVGRWQGKLLRFLNKVDRKTGTNIKPKGLITLTNACTEMLRIDPRSLCQDRLGKIFYQRIRLSPHLREEVDKYFTNDWRLVVEESERCLASFL